MNHKIGILGSHDEQVNIGNPKYSYFFESLRISEIELETIYNPITIEYLNTFDSILMGDPHLRFKNEEIFIIKKWIQNGGNILVLGTFGGDKYPGCGKYLNSHSNFSKIFEGADFNKNMLGKGNLYNNNNIPVTSKFKIPFSILGANIFLQYDTGCSFKFYNASVIIKDSILTPKDIQSIEIDFKGINKTPYLRKNLPANQDEFIYVRYKWDKGQVQLLGSSMMFSNDTILENNNIDFLNYIIKNWITSLSQNFIENSIKKPQRHRLLNGYPMPASASILNDTPCEILDSIEINQNKGLLIGILPHTFCNPMIRGCGFCTFPHETLNKSKMSSVVTEVAEEIKNFGNTITKFKNRKVDAVYIGGGTANLTPEKDFKKIITTLAESFDITNSEISLEGVPKYFVENIDLLKIIKETIPTAKLRISMGIQTFNDKYISLMGRKNFGNIETFKEAINIARRLGYSVSGDFLFNLPNQSLNEMVEDVTTAISLGFDQICIYHLVLFRLLGTEWSKNPELTNAIPDNNDAHKNWMVLQKILIDNGFEQNTVTNFEKKIIKDSGVGFLYETSVMHPEKYDWLGFGPSAISMIHDTNFDSGFKFHNPTSVDQYLSVDGSPKWDRCFSYDIQDEKILYITRKIALCDLDINDFDTIFNANFHKEYENELNSLIHAGYVIVKDNHMIITKKGQFFSDTIASLFAFSQERLHRMKNGVKNVKIETTAEYINLYPEYTQAYHMG